MTEATDPYDGLLYIPGPLAFSMAKSTVDAIFDVFLLAHRARTPLIPLITLFTASNPNNREDPLTTASNNNPNREDTMTTASNNNPNNREDTMTTLTTTEAIDAEVAAINDALDQSTDTAETGRLLYRRVVDAAEALGRLQDGPDVSNENLAATRKGLHDTAERLLRVIFGITA